MNKKLFLWASYDFANSIVLMAFLFYFSQWLVVDQGKPAWWYNLALIISSGLFILTAPYVSKSINSGISKITGLRFWSALTFAGHLCTSLLTIFNGPEIAATILYIFSTYTYLVCFLYYTPTLNDLSTTQDRSSKSGIGQSANAIGQVTGILVTLPLISGVAILGEPGKAQALLGATIIFGIIMLPMLLFYKESLQKPMVQNIAPASSSVNALVSFVKDVFSHKQLALLLISYFLFSDAILTFANNFPLYLDVVHNASDTTKAILTASILILSAIGAIIFGRIADKKGKLKTLTWILIAWFFIFLLLAYVTNFNALLPVFFSAGILFGPVWGISRALVGELSPTELVASSYGYYVIAERFATFIGPALWSIALLWAGDGARGYRVGLITMSALVFISLFFLRKIGKKELSY